MTTPVKNPQTQIKRPDEPLFKRLTRQQLFIPVAAGELKGADLTQTKIMATIAGGDEA